MGSGLTDKSMAMACGKIKQVTVLSDSGSTTQLMATVCMNGRTATDMKVSGDIRCDMDKVKIYLRTVITSLENITTDYPRAKVSINGQTEISITVCLKKRKSTDTES